METLQWFDDNGWMNGTIPEECVADCSASGAVDEAVEYWVKKLGFDVPEPKAAEWLREYGAWDAEELADHEANARRVLWLACGDVKEKGEWMGLIH